MAELRPIIIKKKKIIAAGHHGGAWKVAYADFVTAMMAFFLLMWLINATTEEQKGGIADYFSPHIPMSQRSAVADGMLGGESIKSSEDLADEASDREAAERQIAMNEQLDIASLPGEITDHLFVRMTADGLVIEVLDIARTGLFKSGSAVPTPVLRKITRAIAPVIGAARNRIGISGHTDASQFVGRPDYDNWELSSDRANVSRRLMIDAGIDTNRFVSVAGKAATAPISENPNAPENRRISITLYHASVYPLASVSGQNGAR